MERSTFDRTQGELFDTGPKPMKCLTIDPVWAWAIIHGPKRIENRSWATRHRGPLAIHAGKNTTREAAAREFCASIGLEVPEDIPRGAVVGVVNVVDVVRREEAPDDPFATGPVCWILEDPRPLETPIEIPGQQTLWDVEGVA